MANFQDAHAALLKDAALQFDFPPTAPDPPRWDSSNLHLGSGGTVVVAILVVVAAMIIIVCVAQALRGRGSGAGQAVPASPETPVVVTGAAARAALSDADALAAAGRFVDAVHTLLVCGIDAIEAFDPHLLRPAYTSRDILHLPGIPATTRGAFGAIARAVELGVFGERPIGQSDYAECRSAFVGSTMAAPT